MRSLQNVIRPLKSISCRILFSPTLVEHIKKSKEKSATKSAVFPIVKVMQRFLINI